MKPKELLPDLHLLKLGSVNAYLIDNGLAGLTLIDSGYPKSAAVIERAIRAVGREPAEVTEILVTHAHRDHLGSAAHISASGASVSIHSADAVIPPQGIIEQTMSPGPGLLNKALFLLLVDEKPALFPSFMPRTRLADGMNLAVAGGIEVIHTPGHTPGHVSFLWKRDPGVLFAGDVAANVLGLGYSIGYDDVAAGRASLAKLGRRSFEVALFGHGRPIMSGASQRIAARFGR